MCGLAAGDILELRHHDDDLPVHGGGQDGTGQERSSVRGPERCPNINSSTVKVCYCQG